MNALAANPHPPREAKLSEKQQEKFVELLVAGPIATGFDADLWTYAHVDELVRKHSRASCRPDHLGRILHDLGFSPQ